MKYLLVTLLLLISPALCYSPEPLPLCQQPTVLLKDLPISLFETQAFNMNEMFYGFNLEYNVSASAPNFVSINKKIKVNRNESHPMPGLKNYHLQHQGNSWGSELITLAEEGDTSKIRWTSLSAAEIAFEGPVTVENRTDTFCLDAIWDKDDNIAIVDCVRKMTDNETKEEYLQNVFLYVNTSSQTVMDFERFNDMYAPFTEMRRRKIMAYQEEDQKYLIRAYFADGVNR